MYSIIVYALYANQKERGHSMHLTTLPECIYQGNNVLDIVQRCIAELEASRSPRALLFSSALKFYLRFLTDESLIKKFTREVESLDSVLSAAHPNLGYTIQGRLKSFVSTTNKIVRLLDGHNSVDLLKDVIAFRIVLHESNSDSGSSSDDSLIMECYSVANSLIEFYSLLGYILCEAESVVDTIDLSSPRLKELTIPQTSGMIPEYLFGAKDYIRTPKKNGYQSLHLIFRSPRGLTFEVQIRTEKMDVYASEGYAEHGVYKETKYTNRLRFDSRKVNIPGYEVSKSGKLLKDTSGFELSKEIFFFEKK